MSDKRTWRGFAALLVLCCALCTLFSSTSRAAASLPVASPVESCDSLASVDLTTIGGAGSRVERATALTRNGIAFCDVHARLAPTIELETLLPTKSWTQRYLQVGCGGLCGSITLSAGASFGCAPITHGEFAMAATDMGHEGMSGAFGNDPTKRADFAFLAQHRTALASRALIRAFYGRDAKYAYFDGCSDGGREALIEAQRYPADFNGIVAGAPAMNFQTQNALYHAWQAVSNTGPDGHPILLADRLPLIHRAVLAQCDALDGARDGLIENPTACHFDPATLLCKPGQNRATCLSSDEVAVVKRLYDGPHDPATGTRLIVGGPQPGSELGWAGIYVPFGKNDPLFSSTIALGALQYVSFVHNPGPSFKLQDLAFNLATFERLAKLHSFYDATNPDLSTFDGHGGKLIMWQGWADPHISPLNLVAYQNAVAATMGDRAASFERLYLLPGVLHCGNGEGLSDVDFLTPVMDWVEGGAAPDAIMTHQAKPGAQPSDFGTPVHDAKGHAPTMRMLPVGNIPPRDRPVYPYPHVATYDGTGDINAASSWHEGPGAPVTITSWAGSDFYRPYKAPN